MRTAPDQSEKGKRLILLISVSQALTQLIAAIGIVPEQL